MNAHTITYYYVTASALRVAGKHREADVMFQKLVDLSE